MDEEDSCLTSAAEEFCPAYEKFGQPGASFGAQVLQEFYMDVVITWGCRWFHLLQNS